MIIQLRRRHYYTWLILAILLPFGLILAYFNIPDVKNDNFSRVTLAVFTKIIANQQTKDLKINLRENSEGKLQIEVIILQPLIGAANHLYLSNSTERPREILLGSLASKGIYRFQVPNNFSNRQTIYLEIFDIFKKKVIETIKLTY